MQLLNFNLSDLESYVYNIKHKLVGTSLDAWHYYEQIITLIDFKVSTSRLLSVSGIAVDYVVD